MAKYPKYQQELLTPIELAEFDSLNFKPEHAMNTEEWTKILSTGIVIIFTVRTFDNELAAVCVLKSAMNINLWYCFSIAVVEKYRGMGYGSKLYKFAIEQSIPFSKIQAHCAIDNAESIHLHIAAGFKPVQYVNDFYGDYEDAILWERMR